MSKGEMRSKEEILAVDYLKKTDDYLFAIAEALLDIRDVLDENLRDTSLILGNLESNIRNK